MTDPNTQPDDSTPASDKPAGQPISLDKVENRVSFVKEVPQPSLDIKPVDSEMELSLLPLRNPWYANASIDPASSRFGGSYCWDGNAMMRRKPQSSALPEPLGWDDKDDPYCLKPLILKTAALMLKLGHLGSALELLELYVTLSSPRPTLDHSVYYDSDGAVANPYSGKTASYFAAAMARATRDALAYSPQLSALIALGNTQVAVESTSPEQNAKLPSPSIQDDGESSMLDIE